MSGGGARSVTRRRWKPLCRWPGRYQRAILGGREVISGSTLRGKAKRYGAHYASSVRGLLARLTKAGMTGRSVGARTASESWSLGVASERKRLGWARPRLLHSPTSRFAYGLGESSKA